MKRAFPVLLAAMAVPLASPASIQDPAQDLTRGKLEADLGHAAAATEAFAAVTKSAQATDAQRWEALVRLGVARRDAGDAEGSADAFAEAFRTYGKNPDALRFLLLALGNAVPGPDRWAEVWKGVTLDVERRDPGHPQVRVSWPGVPFGLCPCSGTRVDLDFDDGDLQDVFRLMADISELNIVVNPGTQGRVTYHARQVPWDEALERMLAANGFAARLQGNLLWIGRPGDLGERRSFTGKPISFDYVGKPLAEALREIAAHGGASVEVPQGVSGRVTVRLVEVPWDQAFDVMAGVNGLTWARQGDVFTVEPRHRPESRRR